MLEFKGFPRTPGWRQEGDLRFFDVAPEHKGSVIGQHVLVDGDPYLVMGMATNTETDFIVGLTARKSKPLQAEDFLADYKPLMADLDKLDALIIGHLKSSHWRRATKGDSPSRENALALMILHEEAESWSAKYDPDDDYHTVCIIHDGNRFYGQARTFAFAVCDAFLRSRRLGVYDDRPESVPAGRSESDGERP